MKCIGCLLMLASLSLVSGLCSTCLEERCYDNGECIIGCVPGYIGEYCNEACPSRCLNKRCHLHIVSGTITCTDGCEPGYCDIKCEVKCPGDCVTCDRQCSSCNVTLCPERRNGADCGSICSPMYEKCDRETGQCILCRRGYYGDSCKQACTGCFTRADNIRDTCLSGCEICQSEGPCPVGFHGASCERICSTGCENPGRCNRATGECYAGCVSGYHGLNCNNKCNGHCLSGKCKRATGECSAGCVSGYHGLTCNYTCNSFCEGGICNQHDGVCTSGCISGYTPNMDMCEKYENEGSHTAVAFVVPITVFCLLAGMVIAAVIWRCQSRRPNRSQTAQAEEGTNSIDVAEPLLKYKKDTDSVQQSPDQSVVANPTKVTGSDPLRDILEKTKTKIESETSGMIHVSAVDTVVEMLQSGRNWVTITGNAGDGKTTLAYLVLRQLHETMSVYNIEEPEECRLLVKLNENSVIMLDDRFGAFTANQVLIDKWKNVMNDIHKHLASRGNQMKIIFISRKNVMNEVRDYLGHFRDSILDPENVVDLSSLKIKEERLEILDYYLTQGEINISREVKQRVVDLDIAHGFPHCSMMYPKLKAKKSDLDIEEFFKMPLKFLDITTAVLYTENCKDLFELMIKNNGKFDVYSVKDDDARRASLLKVEREQEGSYITVWKNGVCVFAHPSIYESVLNIICEKDSLFCVKYATLSVIRQKLTLTSDEKQKSPTRINVEPVPAVLKALPERFRQEILQGDYMVFGLRFCDNEDFCKELLASCVYSAAAAPEQNVSKQFINQPGVYGETMLWTALRNGRMTAVHSLVKAGADVDIQDKRGRTPLHHVCQLKNSTGASAKDNEGDAIHTPVDFDTVRLLINKGRGDVNIGDQYGQTPLHYLCQFRNSAAADGHYDDKLKDVVINAMRLIIFEGRGDVNIGDQYGQTPLHYLCQFRNSAAADGHYDDKLKDVVVNAMRLIIFEGRGDVNIGDQYGQTPLHYLFKSCTFTTEEIPLITIQGKGDLNKREQHKSTPLHYLCANSSLQLDTVDLVIKDGKGDFSKGDEHGTTPFHYFCKSGKLQLDVVLQIVNTANGDINKQDDSGITPLHVLCKGSLPMKDTLTLINQGDKADMYGNSPLHFLCRRRGINAEVVKKQFEQIPETDMKKQNNLGYTPLDYLTDKDDSLPWTDGMIARSAADLVLCRLKLGDNWIFVLGRAIILNSERVHELLQVEDFGRVLTNLERSGDRKSSGQFSEFCGTCSSPVPVPPSPSPLTTPPSYWETSSTLTRRERGVSLLPLLEMGLIDGRSNMDEGFCVSHLPHSVCVSVSDVCPRHPDRLCIQVLRRDQEDSEEHQVGECVSLSLPTPDVEFTLTFGLVLDVGRGRVGFIDVERGQLLCKVDLQMKEEVSPMFYAHPVNDHCATRMRLISGRQICVTDRKIHLIQQALSD